MGARLPRQAAVEIQEGIDGLDFFDDVKRMDFEEALAAGLVQWVDDAVVDRFLDEVAAQSVKPEDARATRSCASSTRRSTARGSNASRRY